MIINKVKKKILKSMFFNVIFTYLPKKFLKFIQKRNPKEKENIDNKLRLLKENPFATNKQLDIKKLTNSEFYRLRINNYRFIYEIINDELVILMLDSDNRGDIY